MRSRNVETTQILGVRPNSSYFQYEMYVKTYIVLEYHRCAREKIQIKIAYPSFEKPSTFYYITFGILTEKTKLI